MSRADGNFDPIEAGRAFLEEARCDSHIKRENDMTMEDFFAKSGMDKDSYEAELDSAARKIVKRSLVLEAIADENDINWTPNELKQEINSLALMSGVNKVDTKKVKRALGASHVSFAGAEECEEWSGFRPGGVPPVGYPEQTIDFVAKAVKSVDVPEKKDASAEKEAE